MSFTTTNGRVKQYSNVDNYTGVTDANPHQLVQMLLDGAIGKIANVKGLMLRGDIVEKGKCIGQSISIVGGLRSSLDMKSGGDIAANLDDIYEYIERRLVESNLNNDVTILDEVMSLLKEIKSAWESIPLEARTKNNQNLSVVS